MLGILYISLSWGLMMDLYGIETGNPVIMKVQRVYQIYFPIIVIGSMWVNDTMAYLVGSFIGKTPLSKISPKNMGRHHRRNYFSYNHCRVRFLYK